MEEILFNRNHVKVTRTKNSSKDSKYRIAFFTSHSCIYPEGMTISETCYETQSVIKESPLGFYYEGTEKIPYKKDVKVAVNTIMHNVHITLVENVYNISYYIKCGETSVGFDARPWDICIGDLSMPEHFIKALQKILDEIFVWASPIKQSQRTKEKVYTELFGNPKGYDTLPNEIKIISHGFDPKESFRKRKIEKSWKKKKKA